MAAKIAIGRLCPGSRTRLTSMSTETTKSVVRLAGVMLLTYESLSGEVRRLHIPAGTEVSLFKNSSGELGHLVTHLTRRTDVTLFISATRQVSIMSDGMVEVCNPAEMRVSLFDHYRPARTYANAL